MKEETENLLQKIVKMYNVLRIYDWFDKLELIVFDSTILMIYSSKIFIKELSLLLIFMFFLLGYIFVLNSVTDRKEDIASGKDRYFGTSEKIIKNTVIALLLLTIISSIFIWFLYSNIQSLLISFICIFLGTIYSTKPVRLKERDILALITTSLSMRVFPFLLLASLIQIYDFIIFYLSVWLFLVGFSIGIKHQIKDYKNDVRQKISTTITKIGIRRGKQANIVIRLSIFMLSISSFLFFEFWLSVLIVIGMNLFKFRSGPYK